VAALVLPEVSVYFHKPSRGADIFGYLTAGHDVLNHQDLYRNSAPGKNNTWPPFFSIFITPLAVAHNTLGLAVTKEIWYFLNFTALIGAIQIIAYLLYGIRPPFLKGNSFDFTSDLVFVPVLLVLPALVSNFFMLQINALILFLVSMGLLMHFKKKPVLAGLFFGLAGAIKAYPGLFAIYFLLRKQWKTSFAIMAFGIFFTLSPILFFGFSGYVNLMKEWLSLSFSEPMVVGYTTFNNHSLYAFWERLLAHQLHLTQPASGLIRLFNLSSILILLITTFTIILRSPYRNKPITVLMEFSIICILMILFPPIAWGHYWLLLFPAAASIYYCIRKIPDTITPLIMTLFTISVFLIQIPYFFSKTIVQTFLKSHSSNTIAALVVLSILLILYSKITTEEQEKCYGNNFDK
jgi:alpha-1,2-mannosyltransferase